MRTFQKVEVAFAVLRYKESREKSVSTSGGNNSVCANFVGVGCLSCRSGAAVIDVADDILVWRETKDAVTMRRFELPA